MLKDVYNLVWSINGREQRHTMREYPVFIGRLPYELRGVVKDYNSLGVYIYYPVVNRAHPTGIASAIVSRLHVKLEEEHGRIFLVDHGSKGKGSCNGTYLNSERVQPGQRVLLRPGDSFQLGRLGPVFMLTMRRVEGETIVLREGVPTLMPKSLAEKLVGVKGVQIESYDESSAVVVPRFHGGKRVGAGKLVVYSEKLSERERILKTLFQVQSIVSDALEYIRERQDIEAAKSMIMKLRLQVYRELIEGIEEKEIQRLYRELLACIKMGIIDMEAVARRLQALKYLIRAYVESC